MTIRFIPSNKPAGKLADVELQFNTSDMQEVINAAVGKGDLDDTKVLPLSIFSVVLEGLTLRGFAIWEQNDTRRVTFPASTEAHDRLQNFILDSFDAWQRRERAKTPVLHQPEE
jgi:hypothetical protein